MKLLNVNSNHDNRRQFVAMACKTPLTFAEKHRDEIARQENESGPESKGGTISKEMDRMREMQRQDKWQQ